MNQSFNVLGVFEFSFQDFILILGTVFLIYCIAKFLKDLRENRSTPPFVNTWIPFFGSILEFGKNPLDFIAKYRDKYGEIFSAKILGKQMIFITHPKGHEFFFKKSDQELSPKECYQFMKPVFGRGIVYDAETPEKMMEQIRFISSGMTTERYYGFVSVFQQEVESKTKDLGKIGKLDAFRFFSKLIICTACRCLLGEGMKEYLDKNDLATLYHNLDLGINPITAFLPWFTYSPAAKLRDDARDKITQIFGTLIKQRRENPNEKFDDVLDTMMQSSYKDGTKLSDEHITGILLAGLFAGQHTSTITATWTTLLLATHNDILDRVMKEQKEVMGDDTKLSFEKVSKMQFLDMCVREALRMYPPLVLLMRKVLKELKYNGMRIPNGRWLIVSPAVSGRSSDCWKEPNKFDPDRFARGEHEKINMQYIAFGAGRHKCIGENFAMLQVKSILSTFLRKYDISRKEPLPSINFGSLVAGPVDGGATIEYTLRESVV